MVVKAIGKRSLSLGHELPRRERFLTSSDGVGIYLRLRQTEDVQSPDF